MIFCVKVMKVGFQIKKVSKLTFILFFCMKLSASVVFYFFNVNKGEITRDNKFFHISCFNLPPTCGITPQKLDLLTSRGLVVAWHSPSP